MKELSIEEKAKRYDEAIKRVEDIKTGKCETRFMFTEGLFEHIFPALKESEDERIRENIIATIHLYYGEPLEDEAKEMVAWLEKQGEQKSIEYPLCKTVKDKIDYYIVNHFTTDTVVKTDVNSIVKAMKEGVMIGMSEQKPAWGEEVQKEQVNEEFINALGAMLNDGLPDRYLVSEERIKKSAELLFSIARKQLKNEMQEWSEEDERMLNEVILGLKVLKYKYSGEEEKAVYQREIDWLEHLKDRNT